MDDTQPPTAAARNPVDENPAPALYRCPDHAYEIDRATHLARLASFYPACRECEHQGEVVELSSSKRRGWAQVRSRPRAEPRFASEGFEAATHSLTPLHVTRLAAAVGQVAVNSNERPRMLVGMDGSWNTAELVAAACEAIARTGCEAVELGAVASAPLAAATSRLAAAAALWIGNWGTTSSHVGVKLWGPRGAPWSSPGSLDDVQQHYARGGQRNCRHSGHFSRATVDEPYLTPLRPLFHGLRPLRLLLQTTCDPLAAFLDLLTADTACRITRPVLNGPRCSPGSNKDPLAELRERVIADRADGALVISGDGERLTVLDERGQVVNDACFWRAIVDYACREQPEATLVVEPTLLERSRPLRTAGPRVVAGGSTREAMHATMQAEGALLGRGPEGSFWFAGDPAAPDALMAASLLLVILSASDRTTSEALSSI